MVDIGIAVGVPIVKLLAEWPKEVDLTDKEWKVRKEQKQMAHYPLGKMYD